MIAGELESLDRFQLMERCRMLVGIFEKLHFASSGSEVWETRGKLESREGNAKEDCLRK